MEKNALENRDYIYDSAKRGSLAWEELRGIFQYRDLVYQLVRRDIVARYKRSVLGIIWTMLNPLGMMIVLTVVFSGLFQTVKGYPAYLLSGIIGWTFFAQTTTSAMQQIIWGGSLFHHIYLPRTSFAVAATGTGLINLILSCIPLIGIVLVIGVHLKVTLLFLPMAMVLLAMFSLGVGLILSTLAIYFPDVAEMYQVILIAWMYLTPIIYPPEVIPQAYRYWLFHLNPMYYFIQIFRQPIYDGIFPSWPLLVVGSIVSIATLIAGWIIFSFKADEFTYRI